MAPSLAGGQQLVVSPRGQYWFRSCLTSSLTNGLVDGQSAPLAPKLLSASLGMHEGASVRRGVSLLQRGGCWGPAAVVVPGGCEGVGQCRVPPWAVGTWLHVGAVGTDCSVQKTGCPAPLSCRSAHLPVARVLSTLTIVTCLLCTCWEGDLTPAGQGDQSWAR